MNPEQVAHLYLALKTLPADAQTWLASDTAAEEIITISKRYVLSDNQEIHLPFMIVRLVTQNIPPENFKQEIMKKLAIDQELADRITDALKEKILMPIEQPLKFAGVDIDLLRYNAPAASMALPVPQITPSPATTDKSFSAVQDKPFILHEEPSSSPQQSSFIFNADDTINQSLQTAPPKVIIERVVHYTALRTPLTQAAVMIKEKAGRITIPKSKWFN